MKSLEANNILGRIILFFVGMYGIYIYGQIILFDSKGFWPSTFIAQWFLIFLVMSLNTTLIQLINIAFSRWHKLLMVIFLAYYLASILFYTNYAFSSNFTAFVAVVFPGFILGALYYLNYSNMMPFQPITRLLNTDTYSKRLFRLLGIFAVSFICYLLYLFYVNKFGLTLSLTTVNNEYYQDFGDYFILFYIAWLSIRENLRNRINEKTRNYVSFSIGLFIEMLLIVVLLQIVGSNKAPLTIVLIGMSYFLQSLPKNSILKVKLLSSLVAIFGVGIVAAFSFLDFSILSSLRIFNDSGSDGGISNNTSLVSRINQFTEMGSEQLKRSPIFGDMTIVDYIHSSAISIQTHLGLIGTLLFWLFFAFQCYTIYFRSNDRIAKAITLPVLFVSVISSAFWWLPLWFVAGLVYARK